MSINSVKLNECAACHAKEFPFKVCADCRSVAYCGSDCQSKDWPAHRSVCRKKSDPIVQAVACRHALLPKNLAREELRDELEKIPDPKLVDQRKGMDDETCKISPVFFRIGHKVADLGCGAGTDVLVALKEGCKVLAVDSRIDSPLAEARRIYPQKLQLLNEPLSPNVLPRDGSFDTIWSVGNLMHESPSLVIPMIDSVYASLKPSGKFVVSFLCEGQDEENMVPNASLSDAWALKDPKLMENFLKERGFRVSKFINPDTHEATFICCKLR
ncbi:MAG: zinc finger MYND domain-containing protein [Parachlamydiales bacterium]|nr:zinc finger MYND domain-containing protein [Parachlamydiales bacterium]